MLAWFGRHRALISSLIILVGVVLFYTFARFH
jgi:hypothetical protein